MHVQDICMFVTNKVYACMFDHNREIVLKEIQWIVGMI